MGLPTFGAMYLRAEPRPAATLHRSLYCDAIVEIVKRSQDDANNPDWVYDPTMLGNMFDPVGPGTGVSEWDWVAATTRRFCRVCALEHVIGTALERVADEPTTRLAISPYSPLPAPPRTPSLSVSQRAAERMSRLATRLGGYTTPIAGAPADILVLDTPDRAIELASRNFWTQTVPEGLTNEKAVVSSAWGMFMTRLKNQDQTSDADIWEMAFLAHY